MRENRTYSSEGGDGGAVSDPYLRGRLLARSARTGRHPVDPGVRQDDNFSISRPALGELLVLNFVANQVSECGIATLLIPPRRGGRRMSSAWGR